MVEVKQELAIRSENVQRIYEYYLGGSFLVNRRYQRKLVWTTEEKASFIDSIQQGFPIPIVLVAEVTHDEKQKFEIIDGMQRLNAIVSFIEGEFALKGKHFNLETMAPSKLLLDTQKLSQRMPILDREICTRIASYVFPFSVYKVPEEEKIDEIFRRINSRGKQLCMQELRQAGKTSQFPQLVRKISSAIRKDASVEKLDLRAMQRFSITGGTSSSGINIYDIFWVAQGIITHQNIRASRDEELIAHLLAYMLFEEDSPPPSAKALDHFYGFEVDDWLRGSFDIENALKRKTPEILENQFLKVFNEVKTVLGESSCPFNKLIFGVPKEEHRRRGISYINEHFHVVFLAFYELLIRGKMEVISHDSLAKQLFNITYQGMTIRQSRGSLNVDNRQQNVRIVRGIIETAFKPRVGNDPAVDDWIGKFEKILSQSSTEQALYDFKIGFHDLDSIGKFNTASLSKVVKTLSAMANFGLNSVGYLIIGVADSGDDAAKFKNLHGTSPSEYVTSLNTFYVTGVQDEIKKHHSSTDAYLNKVTAFIKNEPISTPLKNQISSEMQTIRYYDKLVLILTVRALTEPCFYDKQMFDRHGSSLIEVNGPEQFSIFRRFTDRTS
jgi:Protein of unknown function DUF262